MQHRPTNQQSIYGKQRCKVNNTFERQLAMATITKDEISNVQLGEVVEIGDVIGKHRYEGGQVDWFLRNRDDPDNIYAWYGGDAPVETIDTDIDIIDEFALI